MTLHPAGNSPPNEGGDDTIYTTTTKNVARMRALRYDSKRYAPVVAFRAGLPDALWRRNVTGLAPDAQNLLDYQTGKMSWPEYEQRYLEKLMALDAHAVVPKLREKYGPSPILMCHCLTPVQCHRTVLARWLTQHGFEVREWQPPKKAGA